MRALDQEDRSNPASTDVAPRLSLDNVYAQALITMRATDDISLRLLAVVPFVSGIGITLLVRKETEAFPGTARLLVSMFAPWSPWPSTAGNAGTCRTVGTFVHGPLRLNWHVSVSWQSRQERFLGNHRMETICLASSLAEHGEKRRPSYYFIRP